MEKAAGSLSLSLSLSKSWNKGATPLEVQMLTGKRYWYQTAFCLHSLQQVAGREVDGRFKAGSAGGEVANGGEGDD